MVLLLLAVLRYADGGRSLFILIFMDLYECNAEKGMRRGFFKRNPRLLRRSVLVGKSVRYWLRLTGGAATMTWCVARQAGEAGADRAEDHAGRGLDREQPGRQA